jgi:hypothetical protein
LKAFNKLTAAAVLPKAALVTPACNHTVTDLSDDNLPHVETATQPQTQWPSTIANLTSDLRELAAALATLYLPFSFSFQTLRGLAELPAWPGWTCHDGFVGINVRLALLNTAHRVCPHFGPKKPHTGTV